MTPRLIAAIPLYLVVSACAGTTPPAANYLEDFPALAGDGLINVVVEIPAGTNDKWEVDKASGALHWEEQNGIPRVIQFLAYPANYGMVPRTSLPRNLGGDGDPLDVVLLGPRLERGAVVPARPIAVLRLLDDGERDDKILAVPTSGPFSEVRDLETLEAKYGGTRLIIETWFTSYKGPGRLSSSGFGDTTAASRVVEEARQYFEEHVTVAP